MISSLVAYIDWFAIAGLFIFNLHFNLRRKKFKHRKAIHFGVCGYFVAMMIFFTAQSFGFHSHAVRIDGTVTEVTAYNTECQNTKSYFMRRYECTQFQDHIEYKDAKGTIYSVIWPEKSVEGHETPLDQAERKAGDSIALVYAAHNPAQIYPDSFGIVWFNPLAMLGFIVVSMAAYYIFTPRLKMP